MNCWCSHAKAVHGEGGCRLCLGSPYSQAAHKFAPVPTMRPLWITRPQTGRDVR